MKILIIEDTEIHMQSAREQFGSHELEVVSSYEQGEFALQKVGFDVVLTDLMMPKGGDAIMGPKGMRYIFDLLPYGFPLLLLATKKSTPYIGLVTDVNHHDHPMSACIDPLSSAYWNEQDSQRALFRMNDSKVGIFHAPFLSDGRKDWNRVLEVLLK